ncbi:hypothetical protein OCS_01737 [Ophiocordyceps sinensis CO18]|uniref:Alcohol acetyltransferase n=1 Tax=Ophiocordyceps sinensis (strain Co18 / CGMCC 3.14243) TaxID=911162 RepID=T5AJG3_OPHSC|nr:hypothetical protein OCS_01737 [Ophiocordyceps sinensis CO18]
MPPPTEPTPLRPLSNMELFSSSRHHLGLYRCVAITGRYVPASSSPSPLDAEALYPALAALVEAQPMLRVGILGQGRSRPRPRFSHLARLDLRDHEDVVASTASLPFLLGALWNEYAPAMLRPAAPWHGKAIDFSIPHRTRTLAVDVAPDLVAALVAACRIHGTSLTALVHALVLASFARRLSGNDGDEDASRFAASTPINLRPFLDPNTSDPALAPLFRCLVTGHTHAFSPSTVDALRRPDASLDALIWSNAQRIKRELAHRLATLPADDPSASLGYIGDWSAFWRAKHGGQRAESWEVSNIGLLSGGGATWSIQRVFFTNGSMVAGPPLGVNVATAAPAGTLTAGLSWQDTVVPDGFAEQLAADLKTLAQRFHDTGYFSF